MSFIVNNELKKNLMFLTEHPNEILIEFCKSALDYLNNGADEKRYTIAAKKLNTTSEEIQSIIESLVFLLIDCAKNNITEDDFASLKTLKFSEEQVSILWQFVTNKKLFMENILKQNNTKDLRFRELEWRMEAKIASRSLLHQAVPIITMKLHLDSETVNERKLKLNSDTQRTKKEVLLQTDPNNLVHIIEVLEQALIESKTHRTRNFINAFQQ